MNIIDSLNKSFMFTFLYFLVQIFIKLSSFTLASWYSLVWYEGFLSTLLRLTDVKTLACFQVLYTGYPITIAPPPQPTSLLKNSEFSNALLHMLRQSKVFFDIVEGFAPPPRIGAVGGKLTTINVPLCVKPQSKGHITTILKTFFFSKPII